MIESRNVILSALMLHTEIHLSCSILPWLVSSAGGTLGMHKSKACGSQQCRYCSRWLRLCSEAEWVSTWPYFYLSLLHKGSLEKWGLFEILGAQKQVVGLLSTTFIAGQWYSRMTRKCLYHLCFATVSCFMCPCTSFKRSDSIYWRKLQPLQPPFLLFL